MQQVISTLGKTKRSASFKRGLFVALTARCADAPRLVRTSLPYGITFHMISHNCPELAGGLAKLKKIEIRRASWQSGSQS